MKRYTVVLNGTMADGEGVDPDRQRDVIINSIERVLLPLQTSGIYLETTTMRTGGPETEKHSCGAMRVSVDLARWIMSATKGPEGDEDLGDTVKRLLKEAWAEAGQAHSQRDDAMKALGEVVAARSRADSQLSDWARAITELPDAIAVLSEVAGEWYRLEQKYPNQQHPDGTGPDVCTMVFGQGFPMRVIKDALALESQMANDKGQMTWLQVLLNEVFESAECDDRVKLATQLLQIAAVAGKWLSVIITDLAKQPVFLVADGATTATGMMVGFDAGSDGPPVTLERLENGQIVLAEDSKVQP